MSWITRSSRVMTTTGKGLLIDIRTLEVLEGQMPRRALALVLEWAQENRAELMENWELCLRNQTPKKIRPLP